LLGAGWKPIYTVRNQLREKYLVAISSLIARRGLGRLDTIGDVVVADAVVICTLDLSGARGAGRLNARY
jgi:hypothetical protein